MTIYIAEQITHGWVYAVADEDTGIYALQFYPLAFIHEHGDDGILEQLEQRLGDAVSKVQAELNGLPLAA